MDFESLLYWLNKNQDPLKESPREWAQLVCTQLCFIETPTKQYKLHDVSMDVFDYGAHTTKYCKDFGKIESKLKQIYAAVPVKRILFFHLINAINDLMEYDYSKLYILGSFST